TRCQTGARRLRAGLPPNTPVGDRTGTCSSLAGDGADALCANDVGMVTPPSGQHVVIAAFVEDAGGPTAATERLIADSARADCKACARWGGRFSSGVIFLTIAVTSHLPMPPPMNAASRDPIAGRTMACRDTCSNPKYVANTSETAAAMPRNVRPLGSNFRSS